MLTRLLVILMFLLPVCLPRVGCCEPASPERCASSCCDEAQGGCCGWDGPSQSSRPPASPCNCQAEPEPRGPVPAPAQWGGMVEAFEIPCVWVFETPTWEGAQRGAFPRPPDRPPNQVVLSRVCVRLT